MSWLFEDANEYRDEAQAVLERVKHRRRHLPTRIVKIDSTTWIEQVIHPCSPPLSTVPILRPLPLRRTLL